MCPDALVYTIEEIEGSGIERMTQNFRRWSGNMLRNGTRALKLGPNKSGIFYLVVCDGSAYRHVDHAG